jgi:hypothetical protein
MSLPEGAILVVSADVKEEKEEEFNKWYDEQLTSCASD